MDEDISKALLIILGIMLIFTLTFLIYVISIPFWSDTQKVCEYWEKQNGEIVCVKETIVFCLERECSNE